MTHVFLGGTCARTTTWRETFIDMLAADFTYFNPVVPKWDDAAYENELAQRKKADFVLYVITPSMKGVYSIAEVVDDSNKQPRKTIFCVLPSEPGIHVGYRHGMPLMREFKPGVLKGLRRVGKMVVANGAQYFESLDDVVKYLNMQSGPKGGQIGG